MLEGFCVVPTPSFEGEKGVVKTKAFSKNVPQKNVLCSLRVCARQTFIFFFFFASFPSLFLRMFFHHSVLGHVPKGILSREGCTLQILLSFPFILLCNERHINQIFSFFFFGRISVLSIPGSGEPQQRISRVPSRSWSWSWSRYRVPVRLRITGSPSLILCCAGSGGYRQHIRSYKQTVVHLCPPLRVWRRLHRLE